MKTPIAALAGAYDVSNGLLVLSLKLMTPLWLVNYVWSFRLFCMYMPAFDVCRPHTLVTLPSRS